MSIAFLIDGYNLIHALGLLTRATGPGVLETARGRLIALLAAGFPDDAGEVVIVFDAHHAPPGLPHSFEQEGMQLRFAVGDAQADDLIERIVSEHAAPQRLVVVSNDHRLQTAVRKKSARAWTSEALLDYFEKRRERPAPPKPEKPTTMETERWTAEFRDLQDDPAFKELFDWHPFEDEKGI